MKRALDRAGGPEPLFGLLQTFGEAAVTELAVWAGYDFVILDCEHAAVDEPAQLAALRAMKGGGAASLVRLRSADPGAIGRYIKFGADGVIVPDVRTPQAAREIAEAAAAASPRHRALAGGAARADHYGLKADVAADPDPLVLLMMESSEALGQVEAILDTPGIDGLMIGPRDFSASLGAPLDFASPAYAAAMRRVAEAAAARGKLLGSTPHGPYPVEALVAAGHRLLMLGGDVALMRNALVAALAQARAAASGTPA